MSAQRLASSPGAIALISRGALAIVGSSVDEALALLADRDWRITETVVTSRQQVAELAESAAVSGRDAVVAIGGDGTFAAVAGALRGRDTVLVPLPAGTANGWAREMGIPRDPRRAAARLLGGAIRRVDVGVVRASNGEHAFLATAGVGYDAAVVAGTSRALKRWLSVGAYGVAAIRLWPGYQGSAFEVRGEGVHINTRALLVSIGNTRAYGGLLTMLPEADNTDGLLDVCIFLGTDWPARFGHLARVFARRHIGSPAVRFLRLPALEIDATPPQPVQADGDHVASTPVAFTCHHQAVRVLLPAASV